MTTLRTAKDRLPKITFVCGLLFGFALSQPFPAAVAHDASECPVCIATPEEVADLLEKLDRCEKKLPAASPYVVSPEQQEIIQEALDALNAAEQKK